MSKHIVLLIYTAHCKLVFSVTSTVSMFVEYSFNLELYEVITFCDVSVKASCVEIGIHKRVAGLWPRLLRDANHRLPWLTFDVEHSVLDSSDDESDSDIDAPLNLVSRKSPVTTRDVPII